MTLLAWILLALCVFWMVAAICALRAAFRYASSLHHAERTLRASLQAHGLDIRALTKKMQAAQKKAESTDE